jgi:predicted Fe-S protein YdhL (DUF1289 family)
MTILSPCIAVCRIDEASGMCKGCQRTIQEIAAWPCLSDAERAAIMAQLEKRRPGAQPFTVS